MSWSWHNTWLHEGHVNVLGLNLVPRVVFSIWRKSTFSISATCKAWSPPSVTIEGCSARMIGLKIHAQEILWPYDMFKKGFEMQFHWSVCCDGYKKQHKFHEKSIFLTNEYWSRWKTKQGGFVEFHLMDTHIKKYLGFDLFRACICIFSVEMNCLQNYGTCEKAEEKNAFFAW